MITIIHFIVLILCFHLISKSNRIMKNAKEELETANKILEEAIEREKQLLGPAMPVSFWREVLLVLEVEEKYVTASIIRDAIKGKEPYETVPCPRFISLIGSNEGVTIRTPFN